MRIQVQRIERVEADLTSIQDIVLGEVKRTEKYVSKIV